MPVKSYKLGPGTLKFGPTATALDVSCQVRAARVRCNVAVQRTDPTPVLCGEELPGNVTRRYEWVLSATLLQDLAAAGVVDWSWINKGQVMAFEFIPATAAGRKVTGVLIPAPLEIGGEVNGPRPTADLEWPAGAAATADGDDVTGDPTFAAVV